MFEQSCVGKEYQALNFREFAFVIRFLREFLE